MSRLLALSPVRLPLRDDVLGKPHPRLMKDDDGSIDARGDVGVVDGQDRHEVAAVVVLDVEEANIGSPRREAHRAGVGTFLHDDDRFALVREHRALFPDDSNCSRIDPDKYAGHLIRAKVGTTRKSGSGKELTKASQYSVVRELLEIVPEDYVEET